MGFMTAWRLANCPTSRSLLSRKATTDGVVRPPSVLAITSGRSPSSTAITELVVPKSIPTALPIFRTCLSACAWRSYFSGLYRIQFKNPILLTDPRGGKENASTLHLTSAYLMFRRLTVGLPCDSTISASYSPVDKKPASLSGERPVSQQHPITGYPPRALFPA